MSNLYKNSGKVAEKKAEIYRKIRLFLFYIYPTRLVGINLYAEPNNSGTGTQYACTAYCIDCRYRRTITTLHNLSEHRY